MDMENSKLEESLLSLKKELIVTRIFCIISSILTIALLSGGIIVYVQMKPVFQVVEKTGPVIEELSELDTESVNLTLEQINTTLGSVNWQEVSNAIEDVDWKNVSDTIGKLDVEAFNNAVEDLDTKELSKAIERLNGVIDTLEGWGEKLGSIKGLFG